LLDESLAIRRQLNLAAYVGATLNTKGNQHAALGETAEAERCYAESLRVCREMGDGPWIAENLYSMAQLRVAQCLPGAVRPLIEEALALYERTGERGRISACHHLMASLSSSD